MTKYTSKKVNKKAPYRHWQVDYGVARKKLTERFEGNAQAIGALSGLYTSYLKLITIDTDLVAPRLMLTGPVSSGKTSMVNSLAKLLNVPHVTVSGGSLTPEGYRGSNISAGIKSLINSSGSIERLERYGGILHIDEFDKLALRAKEDQFYESLLHNFLGLLGGEVFQVDGDEWDQSGTQLNTQKIMIVLSGAFSWLKESAFSDPKKTIKTLIREGFPIEFTSRLTDHIHLQRPNRKQIKTIIEREAEKLSECYRAGKFTPKLKEVKLTNITKEVINNGLGIRSARRLISQELFQETAKLTEFVT